MIVFYKLKKEVMLMAFKNKTVIVTGAANGIGKAVATLYAEKDACVVIADKDEENGIKTAESIKKKGFNAIFLQLM